MINPSEVRGPRKRKTFKCFPGRKTGIEGDSIFVREDRMNTGDIQRHVCDLVCLDPRASSRCCKR